MEQVIKETEEILILKQMISINSGMGDVTILSDHLPLPTCHSPPCHFLFENSLPFTPMMPVLNDS